MQYTGSRILIETLIEQGVSTIFGYPGGRVLDIYDELYRARDRIRHILVSHEQHAAHAADGYARATGKVGVCLSTSGPGATNRVTGIATAYMDSSPIVALTGNVPNHLLGKDSFQEVDIAGITMPVVKHNWIVKDIRDLAETVREAFLVARSGRPGPVLIDLPNDVMTATADIESPMFRPSTAAVSRAGRLAERNERRTFTDADIARAAEMLHEAKRPVIYAGGGVIIANATDTLRAFAERIDAPVALSLMAQAALPHGHPLRLGMLGMHGSVGANRAIQTCDLLITAGARFSDRVTSNVADFAPHARVLHFDIDPAEINKNVRTDACIAGDINEILTLLLGKLEQLNHAEYRAGLAPYLDKNPGAWTIGTERPGTLHPRFIIEETAQALGPDALIATDVGQHQMWTAQFYPFLGARSFITSGGLGTMGFGLGAAIGAKVARPERPVVLFTGDGSFRMNAGEMSTAANYRLPILIVIFNNGVLGMVRQWQTLFYGKRYAATTLDRPPDFVKLAEAYNVAGFRADSADSFRVALAGAQKAMATGVPALIDAVVDSDAMVYPMVPGGKPLDHQITEA
jgi:acetolactate synthase-1/2/3 large subunit